jgi:enoyl-CoA hydratase/carnithine racemase
MSAVTVKIEGARADLRLNRPEVLNAVDLDVFDGLSNAADEISGNRDVRVVVVSGEGRAFCSGIDVTSLGQVTGSLPEMIARAQAGFRKLAGLSVPTIAAVQGYAYGAGLQIALACDLRVLARDAKVGLLELNYGLIPDLCGSTRLPQLVGAGRAKRMIWLAERIDAAEAERIGIAEWVIEPDRLTATVDEIAGRLAKAPPVPVAESKALIERAHLRDLEDGMDAEAEAQMHCMSDPGFGDAVMAGVQQRASRA